MTYERKEYTKSVLEEYEMESCPVHQSKKWLAEAIQVEGYLANAVSLATVNQEAIPSLRTVLVKNIDEEGYTFFTNRHSLKAQEITHNCRVSLMFFWPRLERQIIIRGECASVSTECAKAYFVSRPRGSKIATWVSSNQNKRVASRAVLEHAYEQQVTRFKGKEEIEMPPFWTGYCVAPSYVEFWQGRENRMHDRLCYRRVERTDAWIIERLLP